MKEAAEQLDFEEGATEEVRKRRTYELAKACAKLEGISLTKTSLYNQLRIPGPLLETMRETLRVSRLLGLKTERVLDLRYVHRSTLLAYLNAPGHRAGSNDATLQEIAQTVRRFRPELLLPAEAVTPGAETVNE